MSKTGGYTALLAEDVKPDDAGGSSSQSDQSKESRANDISHLVKRKKPNETTNNPAESSPAKKKAS